MARPVEGWSVRLPRGSTVYTVRYTKIVNGERVEVERSTGERDRELASKKAEKIYAADQRGEFVPDRRTLTETDGLLAQALLWIESREGVLDEYTRYTYTLYFRTHLGPFFKTVAALFDRQVVKSYGPERLKVVQAPTVRKELSALRQFCEWKFGDDAPVIPGISKRAIGTRFKIRRRSVPTELAPVEVRRLLAALPVRSRGRYPIRARFVLAYETSLRPATLDALSVPSHYTKGSEYLHIPAELDKARDGRPIPLSPAARAALDSVCPTSGIIFGSHDYRSILRTTARRIGFPLEKINVLAPYDFRHARITHWVEQPKVNLVGVQYLAGHQQLSTTSRYVRTSLRAAHSVIGKSRKSKKKVIGKKPKTSR